MLCELTIENVAVIEKATVVFGNGFNVLTGETGAGKSILIDSINAILGNRTSRDVVRTGADKAVIWARFNNVAANINAQLIEAGYEVEDELILYREITKDGKSTCRINGKPANAGIVREICGELINIHGQHDNQSLLNPAKHLSILDTFAGNEAVLMRYKDAYNAYRATAKQMKALTMNEEEKEQRLELLQYQADEITMSNLKDGEEETLNEQKNIIRHSEKILTGLNNAYNALVGEEEENGAVSALGVAETAMQSVKEFSSELIPISEKLGSIFYDAQELSIEIKTAMDAYGFDGNTLEEIEERLDLIYKLKQKYGNNIDEILNYATDAKAEIARISFSEQEVERLSALQKEQAEVVLKYANELTSSRKQAFELMARKIKDALTFLNMPNVEMFLKIEHIPANSSGQDSVEFYIATNAGDEPKPLAKIASGGELSRIMLAIKNALAEKDNVPTLIYDEVDAGIGGAAAGKVGAMLKDTAHTHQVICVTHTGQIAANAATHLLIQKDVHDGRTYTDVKQLAENERIVEIARMLQGDNITQLAIENAKEMLYLAKNA